MEKHRFILKLNEVGLGNIDIAGGKNASLGEMLNNLSELDIKVPDGFLLTVEAYHEFMKFNGFDQLINKMINELDAKNLSALIQCGSSIRNMISNGDFSNQLVSEVTSAYQNMCLTYGLDEVDVAVRSSATAEDLPDASFAGQQETFLNVSGINHLLISIKNCFASLFTDRAISYRQSFGYSTLTIGLSVGVQKMVRSDLGSSGVAFSIDPESGFKNAVVINGSFGLGEMVVQGAVSPDEFITYKPLLKQGYPCIIERKMGNKDRKMVYSDSADEKVKIIETTASEAASFCLSDDKILQLSRWIIQIEDYYSKIKGYWCPMDIEWALDGQSNELFIVQARPETIHSRKNGDQIITYQIEEGEERALIMKGIAVGDKIGSGMVRVIPAINSDLSKVAFNKGDILVAEMTDPDWEPLMKIASAIITERGGRTCHAAIVARELGVPAIVACKEATKILASGDVVTVSCAEGEVGMVYKGELKIVKTEVALSTLPVTETPILLNVASPDIAFQFANLPHQGIGLARMEFIINNYIKIHPLALLKNAVLGESLCAKVNEAIKGYQNGEEYFVDKLSNGLSKIAASAYPRPVIVRFSDFKSNEYANLTGGEIFEPKEENPMIGWRGASRYYSEDYKEAFALECKAIKKVREQLGLDNVIVMIPFCRTVEELIRVYEVMEGQGLVRGQNNLQVYLMAELPSNFLMAEEFADYVDGFSIGSNDLTQLVLGLDRDSSQVAHLYDERNLAVKRMIAMLIEVAKRKNVKVGICGQGPSDFPDFAQFLVQKGIDTISVTPDSFAKTTHAISKVEKPVIEILERLHIQK
jgi:pyruvate,water dikinase